ncbi:hypothetical protein GCM10010532_103730 [Dactylosporangium siamense]|uniref:Insertion element IS402-like domain-containing protein n=1 Tax=Dactylosporangium siamense TaxID=685454 RepID=A0A919PZE4_9ACTN|nr:hypothetical protein Dsi01nite_095440 [Dactylosporangium siamense]
MDAVLYVVRTGSVWRYLPGDFPPWQTVYWYFKQREESKVTEAMLTTLRERARIQQGRNPQPSAGIIDSQSVKGTDTVGRGSRGHDAGKKINGRKRFNHTLRHEVGVRRYAMRGAQVRPDGTTIRWVEFPGAEPTRVYLHGLGASSPAYYAAVATDPALAGRRSLLRASASAPAAPRSRSCTAPAGPRR